jgi:hypothetical protein
MPRDWASIVFVVGTLVLFVIALVFLVRVVLRLRTAFRERLDRLPGGSFWLRTKHGARFWVGAAMHVAIALFLAIFLLIAGRFLMHVALALL